MRKTFLFFLITVTTSTWFGCSRDIIQYNKVSDNDTILMVGKNGGNNYYIKKDLFLQQDSIYLHIKSNQTNLKILSYKYSIWACDCIIFAKDNKLSQALKNRLNDEHARCIAFSDILFENENGAICSFNSQYKDFFVWFIKKKKSNFIKRFYYKTFKRQ